MDSEGGLCPPSLGPVVKFNSCLPHFFNENRIWIVPGIEEVWVFFPSEWRKRKRKDGGKESRRAVPGPARGCQPLPLPALAGAY